MLRLFPKSFVWRWMNLPAGLLIAFLQRTPVLPLTGWRELVEEGRPALVRWVNRPEVAEAFRIAGGNSAMLAKREHLQAVIQHCRSLVGALMAIAEIH